MKVTFTRDEVQEIVLAHVARTIGANLNHVELSSSYYSAEYATVSRVEPEPEVEPIVDLLEAA